MKIRFAVKLFLLSTFLLMSSIGFSQQSIIEASEITNYNNALKLFNNKAYAAAQKTFEKVKQKAQNSSSLKEDASYYDAMCAVKLNQTNADKKVLAFVEENPTSNKKNKAFFNVGNYYFANKKAAHALKWYQKVNLDLLSKENRKELNFKMGYGLLVAKKLALAKDRFLPLINDPKYGNDSRYYYGFIAYKLEDYGLAESTLKEIADNESYKVEISYYLLDISFKDGKFERCIVVGDELLKTAKRKEASEISKIVGESYFNLKKYEEAIPYLKAYKGKGGKWNNTDYYQLGYAYYKQNDFENAISYFNKIIDQKNAVSQNAYYHLAECYLNIEKKNEALNAFKTASEMLFSIDIQEDAALNYAKLSYEEGNPFESVSDVLQNYLKKYPNSKAYNEINELVVSSFINQKEYQEALDYLKKKKTEENSTLLLEVSLYRGIQLFNDQKLQESLSYFIEGKKSKTPEIYQKAQYWEAETLYRLENYEEASTKFIILRKFLKQSETKEFPLIEYNIAYSYFKLKQYEKAIDFFLTFLQKENIDNNIKDDAIIRLGDSYFATRNYIHSRWITPPWSYDRLRWFLPQTIQEGKSIQSAYTMGAKGYTWCSGPIANPGEMITTCFRGKLLSNPGMDPQNCLMLILRDLYKPRSEKALTALVNGVEGVEKSYAWDMLPKVLHAEMFDYLRRLDHKQRADFGKSVQQFHDVVERIREEYEEQEQIERLLICLKNVLKDVENPPPIPEEILLRPSVMKTIKK